MNVHVLRGPPGSGKTHFAGCETHTTRVVSADDYFMENGIYRYNPSKLDRAHGSCMRRFILALAEGLSVVVDNTNITNLEVAPYIAVAQAYEASVRIHVFDTPIQVCIQRCTHGVAPHRIEAMGRKLKEELRRVPPYWPKHTVVSS